MEDRSHAKTFAQTVHEPGGNSTGHDSHYAIFSVFDGHGYVGVVRQWALSSFCQVNGLGARLGTVWFSLRGAYGKLARSGVQAAEFAQHTLPTAITASDAWKRQDIHGARPFSVFSCGFHVLQNRKL